MSLFSFTLCLLQVREGIISLWVARKRGGALWLSSHSFEAFVVPCKKMEKWMIAAKNNWRKILIWRGMLTFNLVLYGGHKLRPFLGLDIFQSYRRGPWKINFSGPIYKVNRYWDKKSWCNYITWYSERTLPLLRCMRKVIFFLLQTNKHPVSKGVLEQLVHLLDYVHAPE